MSAFEWDPDQSDQNAAKHGISFREATEIWQGPHITVEGIAKSKDGETRSATIGLVRGRVYTAVWVKRGRRIRLIRVRRSKDGEKKAYFHKL